MDPLARARPIHARTLDVEVCDSGDGTWAVRGELVDLRKSGFVPVAGDLQMSGLLHHMRVHARLDPGTGIIQEIDAEQPAVAFESSSLSCGESCRDPVERIRALAGTTVAGGFSGRLKEAIGGPPGLHARRDSGSPAWVDGSRCGPGCAWGAGAQGGSLPLGRP